MVFFLIVSESLFPVIKDITCEKFGALACDSSRELRYEKKPLPKSAFLCSCFHMNFQLEATNFSAQKRINYGYTLNNVNKEEGRIMRVFAFEKKGCKRPSQQGFL